MFVVGAEAEFAKPRAVCVSPGAELGVPPIDPCVPAVPGGLDLKLALEPDAPSASPAPPCDAPLVSPVPAPPCDAPRVSPAPASPCDAPRASPSPASPSSRRIKSGPTLCST